MAFVQRTGQDTALRSEKLPAIAIQIESDFRYVGSTSFILYDIAHVEQHHFVVADAERRVLRQLWFQFEGYLENNNRTYNYRGMDNLSLNGFNFLHDAYPMNVEEAYKERPTSDFAHIVDFLRDKGYRLTGDIMFHRMIWLDAELRNGQHYPGRCRNDPYPVSRSCNKKYCVNRAKLDQTWGLC